MKEIDEIYDKMFPKMAEPEEKGIDVHSAVPGVGLLQGQQGQLSGRLTQ